MKSRPSPKEPNMIRAIVPKAPLKEINYVPINCEKTPLPGNNVSLHKIFL